MKTKLQIMIEKVEDAQPDIRTINKYAHSKGGRGSVLTASVEQMRPIWNYVRGNNYKPSKREMEDWFKYAN